MAVTLKSNPEHTRIVHVCFRLTIQLIPQGTVDNKLGLDRLASPKALDYCRQPTL